MGKPRRLINDRAYDSNPARASLVKRGIEPVVSARSNIRVATQQDGRELLRYKGRRMIECSNSWSQNFRRLVARCERSAVIFTALVHLACALISLTRVLR